MEIHHLKLADNDLVLLYSDGLTDLISDEKTQFLTGTETPQNKCEALVNLLCNWVNRQHYSAIGAYHIPTKATY